MSEETQKSIFDKNHPQYWSLRKGKATSAPAHDPGRSLTDEVRLLREQQAELTKAVRALLKKSNPENGL